MPQNNSVCVLCFWQKGLSKNEMYIVDVEVYREKEKTLYI